MPWKPSEPGEIPTLGFTMIDWYHEMLARPDTGGIFEPMRLYIEQEDFILDWYALDPQAGRRTYTRGVLGRPRGWGKSPILGMIALGEALGPVVFDGWDADGQPVGRPWSETRTPIVNIAAVSEEQVDNTWSPMLEMLHEDAAIHDHYPGLEPMETFIALPHGRGRIDKLTASPRTVKGKRAVFTVMDQTEEWVESNGGKKLARVLRSNAAKVGGTVLESPNAFIPGENSVAEGSAAFWDDIRAGRVRDTSLLYDTREAPPETDMFERDSLLHGLRVAYGDSSGHPDGCVIHEPACPPGHVDLDRLISTIWDPEQDVQESRSDFLNQVDAASDSWVSRLQVAGCFDMDQYIEDGDAIVLGFDGSKGRNKGKADATFLVGMRVSDAAAFEIGCWEARKGEERDFVTPLMEVEGAIAHAHERFNVIGFLGDPSGWESQMASWNRKYGRKYRIKASPHDAIAAWPRGKDSRVSDYVESLRKAIANGDMTHDGSPNLVRHLLNARKRATRSGYLLYKKYPDSPDKIDGAYALTLAWRARNMALGRGAPTRNKADRKRRGRVMIS
ncbi:terminase large subunit [Gordonia phage MScarn]|uniref:Terminase large subunit n=4 Tax=Emalynvirus troje TaxID=2560511 RepID=A0A2K9VEL9_9CAUD|nr:terminase large subunit [Gordonia phage Troje]AXH45103.1 terminase large subunit [Gordonia phage SketchMex]QDM56282.1 terminase large subunit [Gordonia phage SweatNTears]QNJ59434.1 terminase large subunit [Gordonia phage Buttrmlkdreams]QWY84877.1 terminase large subunit [Gordonia phage MScarn]AUV60710.1 terminase large subunit [Gordonia phage Troje]